MGLYNPPLRSTQVYSTTNVTPTRTIDPTTISTTNTAQVLATLIADLKTAGILD